MTQAVCPHIHACLSSLLTKFCTHPQKHGLKSASKREKAMAAAEDAAEETMALREQLGSMHDSRVAPDDLLGMHKYRKDKMERMATVLKGAHGSGSGCLGVWIRGSRVDGGEPEAAVGRAWRESNVCVSPRGPV